MAQTIIHLDTSFLIRAMGANSAGDRDLREWIAAGTQLGMSCIGWAELLCGPLDSRQVAGGDDCRGARAFRFKRIRSRPRNCSTARGAAAARSSTA
jgi:predicted nucleic acid-binding protein